MLEVGDVEYDLHAGLAVFGAGADVADVALGVADHAGDAFQHPKTVIAVDSKLHRISSGSVFVAPPFDVDAALRFVHEVCDVGTVHRVHCNSLATSDVANDGFSSNRIATTRTVDQHVALALDHDGIVIAKDA